MEQAKETVGKAQQLVNFGKATKALKDGKRVQRFGWGDSFIFLQIPSSVAIDIVPKMTSLPESVKDEFIRRQKENSPDFGSEETPYSWCYQSIRYSNQIAKVNFDNTIEGWTANPVDILTEDWIILD